MKVDVLKEGSSYEDRELGDNEIEDFAQRAVVNWSSREHVDLPDYNHQESFTAGSEGILFMWGHPGDSAYRDNMRVVKAYLNRKDGKTTLIIREIRFEDE